MVLPQSPKLRIRGKAGEKLTSTVFHVARGMGGSIRSYMECWLCSGPAGYRWFQHGADHPFSFVDEALNSGKGVERLVPKP